jgi:hypothetical protein
MSGTTDFLGRTSVSGPGQNFLGPELSRETERDIVRPADQFELIERMNVNDQRIFRRATFGAEDFRTRLRIEGIRGETINGLGRYRDQVTCAQAPREESEISLRPLENPRLA